MNLPHIIFLEDDPFFRDQWQRYNFRGLEFVCYESPIQFRELLDKKIIDLSCVQFIVTDNFFEFPCKETGLEFAAWMKSQNFARPIFLTSAGLFNEKELSVVTSVLSKDPRVAIEQLESFFKDL